MNEEDFYEPNNRSDMKLLLRRTLVRLNINQKSKNVKLKITNQLFYFFEFLFCSAKHAYM